MRDSSVVLRTGLVGIEVFAASSTLSRLSVGEFVQLHTHLVVKEDLLNLYGSAVRMNLSCSPTSSPSAASAPGSAGAAVDLPVGAAARAIVDGDAALLATTPGIGKRTAERLILELGGRLPEELLSEPAGRSTSGSAASAVARDATEALLALGFREAQVRALVAELTAADPEAGAETVIRKALARLR